MAKGCFIDNKGNIFNSDSLHKAAEHIPVTTYHINTEKILEEMIMWKLKSFHDFLVHFERVAGADLATPLILRSDGYVMDGWHRIIKAIHEGITELPAKKFIEDPEPDFKS